MAQSLTDELTRAIRRVEHAEAVAKFRRESLRILLRAMGYADEPAAPNTRDGRLLDAVGQRLVADDAAITGQRVDRFALGRRQR
jgi:hypothetical protein